jgi:WD40 repeat protein
MDQKCGPSHPASSNHPTPEGSLLVTAGGNQLCVWDLVGGGRLLRRLSNFQKTVTCVRMSPLAGPDSAAAPRMLAGSLDGHVKVRNVPYGQLHYLQLMILNCFLYS